jgi:ATP-binding cassette subfamily F protein 3
VTSWTGNYTAFREQRAAADARQERLHRAQEREVERLEFQARRLKDMANAYDDPKQAKRAKAMERRIERMETIERPDTNVRKLGARLGGAGRHGRIALRVTDFTFAYGDRVLFDRANLDIEYGERVALVGPNGSGKTSLINQILEHGGWENETLRLGKAVRVGQYSQLHEDALDASTTLVRWAGSDTGLPRRAAADLLHRFGFSHDDLERPISTLSGGEKSRLQLARLTHLDVNLLVLDEPTNHLDIEACEQLEETLLGFDGTLLVISHDRYFLERLVTRVAEVKDRQLVTHECGFAEWWRRHKAAGDGARRGALELRSRRGAAEHVASRAQTEREQQKERQRTRRRLETEMRSLEKRIAALETDTSRLEAAVEAAYGPDGDPERGAELAAELTAASARLGALYARWERAGEEVEQLAE